MNKQDPNEDSVEDVEKALNDTDTDTKKLEQSKSKVGNSILKGVANAIHILPITKIFICILIVIFGISAYDSIFQRNQLKSVRQSIHEVRDLNTKQLRDSEQHIRTISSLNSKLTEQGRGFTEALRLKSDLENTNRDISEQLSTLRTGFNSATDNNSRLGSELQQVKQQLSDLEGKYSNITNQLQQSGQSVDDFGAIIKQLQEDTGRNQSDSRTIDEGIGKLTSGWKDAGNLVGQIRSTVEQYCTCEFP